MRGMGRFWGLFPALFVGQTVQASGFRGSRSLRDDKQEKQQQRQEQSNGSYLNQSAARSSQVGLTFSISSILRARFQSLSSFSRAMALRTYWKRSKYTSRSML